MEANEKVQEYYNLSKSYLQTALDSLDSGRIEPAMFNAIHALELAIKSTLPAVSGDIQRTHNVGGVFGRHFRDEVRKTTCKRVNTILSKYNLPRYPGAKPINKNEAEEDIEFVKHFIEVDIPKLLKML
ncbi:MAG: HEPN domain-containing protein [Methanocellales archaeon]|nr:HEPN domain-containing protein [Methanocellales archaeon]